MLLSLMCLSAFGSQVSRTNKGFFVKEAGLRHKVESGMVDKNLRSLSPAQITYLSDKKLIDVSKCTDGTYVIRPGSNLKGGGPIAGWIAYWTVKSLGITTAVASVAVAAPVAIVAAPAAALGIESASVAAGAAFLAMPFLP